MKNTFILEYDIKDDVTDKSLFTWAKKIESLGYEVSQIWETEDRDYYDCGTKGINFSMQNSDYEGIVLCLYDRSHDKSDIRVCIDHDFLSQNGYIEFLNKIVNEWVIL